MAARKRVVDRFVRPLCALALTIPLFGGCVAEVEDPTVASLDGAVIELWVPFREGGGTDTWARALRPWLEDAIPGDNDLVIVNYSRAGGIGGANQFRRDMTRDGRTLLATSGSIQVPYLLGDRRVRYDYDEWKSVFATPSGGVVYVPSELGVESAADLAELETRVKYGSQGIATLDLLPLLSFEMLGLDVRPVFGLRSKKEARLAMLRGELQIDYQTMATYIENVRPLVEEGRMVELFTWGALDADGALVRDPTRPDLPHFGEVYEMVHGRAPSGPEWEAWQAFFTAGFAVQKFLVVDRTTPPEIVEALESAFAAMAADPEFQRAMEPELGAYRPVTGERMERAVARATSVDEDVRAWVIDWLDTRFGYRG